MKPTAIMERSREIVLAQWRELLRLRREVLKTSDIVAIHDLRVASRRFRAALGLFEPWLPPKKVSLIKKNIRKLTQVLGGLRNIDEALLFFRLHTTAESAGINQLRYLLTQMRSGELKLIEDALTAFDHHRLNRIVRKIAVRVEEVRIKTDNELFLPNYLSDTSSRLFQPIHDLLPAAISREQREARHTLRIAIKKWRYFLEIAAPILESDYSSVLGLLKEYQTVLGGMNDVVEFSALCDTLILTRRERRFIEATLLAEDELLLQKLTELIKQKPLKSYALK